MSSLTPEEKAQLADLRRLDELSRKHPNTQPKRAKTESPGMLAGVLTSFGQGASFGFSDELAGLAQSALPFPYGTKGKGGYELAANSARAQQDAFSEAHPVADLSANLAGGVVTGIASGGLLSGGTALGRTLPQLANVPGWIRNTATGIGAGGLAGIGYADEDESLSGMGQGAALGGGFGLAAPPLMRFINRGVRGVAGYASESLRSPSNQATRKIIQAMERDGLTPAEMATELASYGDDAVYADVGKGNVSSLAEAVTTQPGRGSSQIKGFLTARMKNQSDKLEEAIAEAISGKTGGIANINALANERKELAAPLYDKAYKALVPYTDELKSILNRNVVKKALRSASDAASDEGDDFLNSIVKITDDGSVDFIKNPTFRTLDYVKRGLDDVIERETSDFGRVSSQGRRALNVKNELLSLLDDASPDYREARRIYSDSLSNENALLKGRKFLSEDYDVLEQYIGGLSESEKDFFKMGVARSLRDRIRNKITTGNQAQVFNKEMVWDKLKPVFGDDNQLNKFISIIEAEQAKARTFSGIMGNSKTAERLAAQADLNSGGFDTSIIEHGASGNTSGMVAGMFRKLTGRSDLPEPVRNRIAEMLLSNDPKIIAEATKLLNKTPVPGAPILPSFAGPASVITSGGLLGQYPK
tara:strand:- start:97 stop:2040 length:1944 start_codon:yes stop_codon:yes gene_type:complete